MNVLATDFVSVAASMVFIAKRNGVSSSLPWKYRRTS